MPGARAKGKQSQGKLERAYGKLLNSTSRVVGQAKRFSKEIAEGVKRAPSILKQLALEGLRQELDAMVPRVKQVMKQTRARILRGDTRADPPTTIISPTSYQCRIPRCPR